MNIDLDSQTKDSFSNFLFGRMFAGWPITRDEIGVYSGSYKFREYDETRLNEIIDDLKKLGLKELPVDHTQLDPKKPQYCFDIEKTSTSLLGEFLGLTKEETTYHVVKAQGEIETFLGPYVERQ